MANIKQKCDFCEAAAIYDGKTRYGPWAYMCQKHFDFVGVKTKGLYSVIDPDALVKKVCSRCGQEKPLSEFYMYVDTRGVTRYRPECKKCNLKRRKKKP